MEKKKKTNFDVLTESPEKLNKFILENDTGDYELGSSCNICVGCEDCDEICIKGVLAWLKMEVGG